MSRVALSLIRQCSPEDFQQLVAWYKIRDLILGENSGGKRDVGKALELATVCRHPHALWLTKIFAGHGAVVTVKEATRVFRGIENDPRALCFAAILAWDGGGIRQAADLGDGLAQTKIMTLMDDESFRRAEISAAQGDRDGFYSLGHCYNYGEGCEKNVELAKEFLLIAAELGNVCSMEELGELLEKTNPQRYFWFGMLAVNGYYENFLNEISEQMQNFNSGIVFAIGRALNGQINIEKGNIFDVPCKIDRVIRPARQALDFYEFQLYSCRRAVSTWTLIGLRYKVVKDIRKMIGKMIWDTREEALYLFDRKQIISFC